MLLLHSNTKKFIKDSMFNILSYFIMDSRSEQRNKKKEKFKRNKGFPYKRLKIREEERFNERRIEEEYEKN